MLIDTGHVPMERREPAVDEGALEAVLGRLDGTLRGRVADGLPTFLETNLAACDRFDSGVEPPPEGSPWRPAFVTFALGATLSSGLAATLGLAPVGLAFLSVAAAAGLYAPAGQAMTADLTDGSRRDQAYALLKLANNVGFNAGFVGGGVLYAVVNVAVFPGDGLTSGLFALLLFAFVPRTADETDPVTGESVADTIRRKYDYLDRVTVRDATPFEAERICGFDVRLVPVGHPPIVYYGLRVEDPETNATLSVSGDKSFNVPDRSRRVLTEPDLFLADAIVPASLCDYHPLGGKDHALDGTPQTFGTKHMTREGALALVEELDADRTRLVHVAYFYPADEAFGEPLAVDGERSEL